MAGQIEYHKVLDACWHNDIFVRLKPINRGYKSGGYPVKINLEINWGNGVETKFQGVRRKNRRNISFAI